MNKNSIVYKVKRKLLRISAPMLPDKFFLKQLYKLRLGSPLNLENPQTYNEKLQWLKLYDRKPEYTVLQDKYAVRDYVAKTIGSSLANSL